jgi:outer membrane protein assembly factor BamB
VTRLDGRVTWGPVSSGGRILLATSKGELLCFGSDQKQKWSVDLTHGSPTGEPLVVGSDYLIATTGGAIMRLVVENGDLGGVTEIGEPLHGTPLLVDGKVAAVGSGGTFFLVDLP